MDRTTLETRDEIPLVATRLRIPQLRGRLMSRGELLARLDAIAARKLALISAPVGSGKTTLLSQWSERAAAQGWRVGWVALDGDGDPARFWTYFLAAIESIAPGTTDEATAILEARRMPVHAVVTVLVNALSELEDRLIVVLDDYDLVDTQAIHDGVAFLLEQLPPNLHLALLTRVDPPLPLARLRLQGEMIELRTSDLSFSPGEAAVFFNDIMGLGLSPSQIQALEARTEGWPAGLQAAALSMQGRADVASFIAAFTGSQRYVMDYLVEEVLSRQPPWIQSFLLQTAVAARLCGSLCDVLTGGEDGQEMLERLEGAGLFLVALDDERKWYRYHNLFADMLRHRLSQMPGGAGPYHLRACEWFRSNEMPADAVEHALAASDYERAAAILEPAAAVMLMREGRFAQFTRWLARFPAEERKRRPMLGFWHAAALFFSAGEGFEAPLAEAEAAWQRVGDPEGQGSVLSLRAHLAWRRRDYAASRRLAERALTLLPSGAPFRQELALHALGLAFYALGYANEAAATLGEARKAADLSKSRVGRLPVMAALAHVLAIQGRLRAAASAWQEVVEAGRHSLLPSVVEARLRLADLQRELGNTTAAERLLRDGVAAAERAGLSEYVVFGLVSLSRTASAGEDAAEAAALLAWAAEAAAATGDERLEAEVAAYEVRRRLMVGDLASAEKWLAAQSFAPGVRPGFAHHVAYLTHVRVLIRTRAPAEALAGLEWLKRDASRHGRKGQLVELYALQALAMAQGGRGNGALRPLADALLLAAEEGYVRVFLDEGPAMTALLHEALQRKVAAPYTQRLLSLAGSKQSALDAAQPAATMVEPLSEREREVLALIAHGASNQEIAAELTIALTTAKKHISNIIGKLGAANRVQAVARARQLGLL